MDLEQIILTRVAKQFGRDENRFRLDQALNRSIWIYGKFGIRSRCRSSSRKPLKRLLQSSAVKVPINKVNRVLSYQNFGRLYPYYQKPVIEQDLVDIVTKAGSMDRYELAKQLDLTIRKLNYRVRKEQGRWNLVKLNDTIWDVEAFCEEKEIDTVTKEELIVDILTKYPFLTAKQLSHISGIQREALAQPISNLATQKKIRRGLIRKDAPDEIFAVENQEIKEDTDYPPFVLEKRDALVEITKLERYFDHQDADYWLFVDGIPQAEFDMDRLDRKNNYQISELGRFETTTYELTELLDILQKWGKDQNLKLDVHMINEPISQAAKTLTDIFISRGYRLEDDSLLLDLQQKKAVQSHTSTEEEEKKEETTPTTLNWKTMGEWVRRRQGLVGKSSPAEIIYQLGQLDDIQSLSYRTNTPPGKIELNDLVYLSGINYRMGFVHKDHVSDIIKGWPRGSKIKYTDKKILDAIDEQSLTTEQLIAQIGDATKIRQRLRYLEQHRLIRRDTTNSLDFESCLWMKFNIGLNIDVTKATDRQLASVGTFFVKLLDHHPPLTMKQISKYLGLKTSELKPIIKRYQRRNKIVEGYFFEGVNEIQYTTPDVLDADLQLPDDDQSAVDRVDILPLSDPFAKLHLPQLVLEDKSIQLARRLSTDAEQWMISWDGQPVGYLIMEEPEMGMIDYLLEVKITQDMLTTPIIAGTLQQIVTLQRSWYNKEGKITTINDTPAADDKWESIHFLIESIGLQMKEY